MTADDLAVVESDVSLDLQVFDLAATQFHFVTD